MESSNNEIFLEWVKGHCGIWLLTRHDTSSPHNVQCSNNSFIIFTRRSAPMSIDVLEGSISSGQLHEQMFTFDHFSKRYWPTQPIVLLWPPVRLWCPAWELRLCRPEERRPSVQDLPRLFSQIWRISLKEFDQKPRNQDFHRLGIWRAAGEEAQCSGFATFLNFEGFPSKDLIKSRRGAAKGDLIINPLFTICPGLSPQFSGFSSVFLFIVWIFFNFLVNF